MMTVLIGHRGVGKSALLNRLKQYGKLAFDLDEIIVHHEGLSIDEIFAQHGEAYFRELEKFHFFNLLAQTRDGVVAVGAGFEFDLPRDVHVVWVRRTSDSLGRIFLNRPRLNSELSAYEEYQMRRQTREPRFQKLANEELTLLEGFIKPNLPEQEWFNDEIHDVRGVLTLLPEMFNHDPQPFLARRLKWGVSFFEIRDDLLNTEQIQWCFDHLPHDKILFSHRRGTSQSRPCTQDWALELGPAPFAVQINSAHERTPDLSQDLAKFDPQSIAKFSPLIETYAELWQGHEWVSADPVHRAFLPRSLDGRWSWYRLWMKNRMALNFWREGEGSSLDQPFLLEWTKNKTSTRWFAAVLGDPVAHSWTPMVHDDFFSSRSLPVFRITVSREQWQTQALSVLQQMGLRFAAVTSPLKQLAYLACYKVSEPARKFQSVNSLRWMPEGWQGTNTDEFGLQSLLGDQKLNAVVVWGGGGTLGPLYALLPDAQFFSARTGESRSENEFAPNPETVVWAVGRAQMKDSIWPPPTWSPKLVIDLNYAENSPGREYALAIHSQYRSGAEMFFKQAERQQEFWK